VLRASNLAFLSRVPSGNQVGSRGRVGRYPREPCSLDSGHLDKELFLLSVDLYLGILAPDRWHNGQGRGFCLCMAGRSKQPAPEKAECDESSSLSEDKKGDRFDGN